MDKVKELVQTLKQRGKTLATAESCTGGLLGKRITDVSGSSAVYPGGIISYANEVKRGLLGVSQNDLDTLGAVSEPVARQMARGVRAALGADLGVGITGIAGPKSDGTGKPVGLVYIGVSDAAGTTVREYHFSGTRAQIRRQSADAAAELVLQRLYEAV